MQSQLPAPFPPPAPDAPLKKKKKKKRAPAIPDLPTTLPTCAHHLALALPLLIPPPSRAVRLDALRLLDAAVGLHPPSPTRRTPTASTLPTRAGINCLPLYLVRRVEYERALRAANASEMHIAAMHSLFSDSWYFGDVRNSDKAADYLMRATLVGNRFAKRVLDWLAPDRSKGLNTNKDGGWHEYLRAIRAGERDRAVELGRMIIATGAASPDGPTDRPHRGPGFAGLASAPAGRAVRADATILLKMPGLEQKALAANNIGYLLAHGAHGLERDVTEALCYYELAIQWDSPSAACNLAFLLHYGADGDIRRDGARARVLYELAVKRGERNYAPRNLAILLHHGAPGVRADVVAAARYLLMGLREGNDIAKIKCARSLTILVRSWRIRWSAPALKRECEAELSIANRRGKHIDDIAADSGEIGGTNPYGM